MNNNMQNMRFSKNQFSGHLILSFLIFYPNFFGEKTSDLKLDL